MTLTTVEQIRLLIHDKNGVVFTSDEIEFFYSEGGNIYEAAYLALISLASDKAKVGQSIRIGAFSTSESSAVSEIKELAREYKAKARSKIRAQIVEPEYMKYKRPATEEVDKTEGNTNE